MFHEGRRIGSYTLLRKLGKGGFGEVWLAEKRSQFVTKKVAIKLPLDEQVNLDAIRQEAELWEQASGHPNVLPIIDADVIDGQVVIVSEYAEGGSLADKLKRDGKLPLQKAVEMTIGILNGLEFLHGRKIIHRDIKPQNILLQGDTPRLADFGISRAMNTTVVSSAVIGTDAYMSPESFDGKRTIQTDIWAVGVVLYALLAGRLPFPQEHPSERMFAILTKEFEPLSPEIPLNLQRIVQQALAKQPENRYRTTGEMRDALQRALVGIAHPSFAPTEIFRRPGENPATIPLVGNESETENETVVGPPQVNNPAPTQAAVTQKPESYNFSEVPPTINQSSFSRVPQTGQSPVPPNPFQAVSTGKNKKTNSYAKPVLIASLAVLLPAGIPTAGYFIYQKAGSVYEASVITENLFGGLSKEEMELLLEDANPEILKRMKEDPEVKKQQIESLRQMFALARQAIKESSPDANTRKALEIIDTSAWAQNYDREMNKDKNAGQFALITEKQVREFYGEGANPTAEQKQNNLEFEEFLKVQLAIAVKNKSVTETTEPSAEERKQLKDQFARVKIYEKEAKTKVKSGALPEKFKKKAELNSKLQQAQFLARMYSEDVLAKKTEVTDDEARKYIAERPELIKNREKKAKALGILQRLKKGEDFAKLAKEFSEDPGSKDNGGLYENVENGTFEKNFETAALALEPGQITAEPVETSFGLHIIKLEGKGETKNSSGQVKQNYTVRHILFSTMIKDPEDPAGRELPVREYAKKKLEDEKQKQLIDKILADNPVSIAEDFRIPDVSDEEIRKSQVQPNSQSNVNSKNSNK